MNSVLNPNYIAGFVDGEGCFSITVNKRNERLPEVRLLFEIELEESDEEILRRISATLCCGKIYKVLYDKHPNWKPHSKLKVSNFRDISEKVIPFFTAYPLEAKKRIQFEKFCKVADAIKAKRHLKVEGVEEILRIRRLLSHSASSRYSIKSRRLLSWAQE